MKKADLHIHSYYSDSTLSPKEIAEKASKRGLSLISVCDHDSIDAYPEIETECNKFGIGVVRGVEITSDYLGTSTHILAYNYDINSALLKNFLEENRKTMEDISEKLIKKMEKDFSTVSFEDYQKFVRNPKNGGWKGVDYLISKKVTGPYPKCMELYKRYDCGYKGFKSSKEVINLIHNAGGKAVLAHIGVTFKSDFNKHMKDFLQLGIDGFECYYPAHSKALINECVNFSKENSLLITAGSDDHGGFGVKKYSPEASKITEIRIENLVI